MVTLYHWQGGFIVLSPMSNKSSLTVRETVFSLFMHKSSCLLQVSFIHCSCSQTQTCHALGQLSAWGSSEGAGCSTREGEPVASLRLVWAEASPTRCQDAEQHIQVWIRAREGGQSQTQSSDEAVQRHAWQRAVKHWLRAATSAVMLHRQGLVVRPQHKSSPRGRGVGGLLLQLPSQQFLPGREQTLGSNC